MHRLNHPLPVLIALFGFGMICCGPMMYEPPVGPEADLESMQLSIPSAGARQTAVPAISYPTRIAIVQLTQQWTPHHDPLHPHVAYLAESDRADELAASLRDLMWVESVEPFRFSPDQVRRFQKQRAAQPDRYRHGYPVTRDDLLRLLRENHAELALIYTLRRDFDTDNEFWPASLLTLGLAPTTTDTADVTGLASLIDARTGYVYALAKTDESIFELRNDWMDSRRTKADTRATRKVEDALFTHFKKIWPELVKRYPPTR